MMRTKRLVLAAAPILLTALAQPASLAAQTAPSALAAAPATNGVGSAFELAFWQSVTGSEDAASYEAYLARYPDGTFSGLARARIAALQRALAVLPAAASAAAPVVAPQYAPQSGPQPAPAVLIGPQTPAPLAPLPAATMAPAPAPPAEMIQATAPVSMAAAGSTPLSRLLAQLRGSDNAAEASTAQITPQAEAPQITPQITVAPPVQPLAANSPAQLAPTPALAVPAGPATASYTSARPLLLPVPEVLLPANFCSIDARNQFHNTAYRPAVEVATRNNEAAVAYLQQLQQTYDRGQLGRDTAVLNAIAAEARAYQAEAARAYTMQAALVRQFDALMAVPMRPCAAPVQ